MSTYFIADLHLGDPKLKLMRRPFQSVEEAAEVIRDRWNNTVRDDDDAVIVNGDVCYDPSWLPFVSTLRGQKILVKGNYDRLPNFEYLRYFHTVVDSLDLTVTMGDRSLDIAVRHYPQDSVPDRFNLTGHIHDSWKVQKNMLNVGVDVWHFTPVTVEQVFMIFDGICDFFDDDVWVANHEANLAHEGRGRKTNRRAEIAAKAREA